MLISMGEYLNKFWVISLFIAPSSFVIKRVGLLCRYGSKYSLFVNYNKVSKVIIGLFDAVLHLIFQN